MDIETFNEIVFNKIRESDHIEVLTGHEINIGNANERQTLGLVSYPKWRVIGLGLLCTETTTDGEAPILKFGDMSDDDMYGIFTIITDVDEGMPEYTSKGMHESEYTSMDLLGYLPADDFDADAPVYTWSEAAADSKYKEWQTAMGEITVIEAAAEDMSSGKFIPYAIIEYNTGIEGVKKKLRKLELEDKAIENLITEVQRVNNLENRKEKIISILKEID